MRIDHFPFNDGAVESNRFIEIEFRSEGMVRSNGWCGGEQRYDGDDCGERFCVHGFPQPYSGSQEVRRVVGE
jgi:hypothetical protein